MASTSLRLRNGRFSGIGGTGQDEKREDRRAQRAAARLRRACFATATLLGGLAASNTYAQTLYWDTNGATAGASAGTTASNNWTATSTFWSTSSAGTVAPGAWTPGASAIFSAGTNATGTSNVTLTGSQSVSSITFEDGTVALTTASLGTGAIAMSGASLTVTNASSGKTNSLLVPVTGAGGLAFLNTSGGNAVLNIDSAPQFQGNLDIGAGTGYTGVTRVQLSYALANPAALINMRNFSALGNDNVVTDPVTNTPSAGAYTVANDIHLNVDNLGSCESFLSSSNGRTVTYTGVVSGNSNLNIAYDAGGGAAGRGTVVLANHETYVGDTFINILNTNGMLRFGIENALPTATNVTVGGTSATLSGTNAVGPIDLAGFNQQWSSLKSGTGAIAGIFNTGGAATLTVSGTTSGAFRGPIGKADSTVAPFNAAGSGTPNTNISLVKGGTSTLTLTASNAFTGDTTINGGTLVAGFASTLASTPSLSGNVNVNNTGTLYSAGGSRNTSVYISGAVNVNSGGNVSPGGTDTATLKPHDLFLNDGGHIRFDIQSTTDYDLLDIAGGFNLDSGTHTIDVGISSRSGAALAAGSYLVAQYGSRNWDGIAGLTVGSTPGGAFNYSLDFQDNLLYLNVVPVGPTYRWSVGSTFPATEGGGTWQDGAGNFIDLANSNTPVNWNNAGSVDVIFGGDPNQTGGTITLSSNIVVNGTMRFSAIAAPYAIGDGSNANTLTLAGNLAADTPATLNAPVIVAGSGHSWNINTGQTLTVNGTTTQATGETNSLTKAGSGVVAFFAPVTLNAINVTGGAVESWADGVMTNVPTVTLDGNSALRAMAAQTIPSNITIGTGGGQLTVTGAAGTATMSGAITSTGNVTKQGSGTLVLTNNSNTIASWTLAGFAAGFQSQVAFSAPGAIGAGPVNLNGGGLQLLAPMTLTNNVVLQAQGHGSPTPQTGDGSAIDIGSNNATLTGVISGGGDLHKRGSGTLTLAGNNTYQGGAFFIETASTIITTSSSALGAATVWPAAATTLDVETNLNTACFRGNGALAKTGPAMLNAGSVGGVPTGFNEGASLTANQGVVQMTNVSAFGGRMDLGNTTFATTTAAGQLPQAAHAQYNLTMNSGTELIDNFNGQRFGGSITLNNATMTRASGLAAGEGNFDTYNTWTLNTTPTVSVTSLNYGSSLSLSGSVTLRSFQTTAQTVTGGNLMVFTMPVNVAAGASLTISNANSGGYDNNNFIGFRGIANTNFNFVNDAFTIQAGASVTTQGPGQVRWGRTASQGKLIAALGTPGNESLMKLSSNSYFSDAGSQPTIFGVSGSGNAGLRIEAPMAATYTDRSVDPDPTHHDGTTGLLGANTTNTAEGQTPTTGFSVIGNAFTVMSGKRLNALGNSPSGTLTLAANDATDATGTIDNGPSAPTPLKLALDNTASSASANLVYQIIPNANGMKFANFGGLVVQKTSAGAGTVTARVPARIVTGSNNALRVNTLSIAPGSAVDLTDNDLVVNNGSYTDIKNLVLSGFGNPTGGITSSTSDGSEILALFDNALVGATEWPGGTGATISANAIVGKYTYFGDVNFDGQVTGDDYTIVDSNLNTTPPIGFEWLSGDANLDGIVTGDDYTTIDSNLGLGSGNPLSPSALGTSAVAVPEPASLALLAAGAGMLMRRRHRSR